MVKTYVLSAPTDDSVKDALVEDLYDLSGTQGVEIHPSEDNPSEVSLVLQGLGFSDAQVLEIVEKHGLTLLDH